MISCSWDDFYDWHDEQDTHYWVWSYTFDRYEHTLEKLI